MNASNDRSTENSASLQRIDAKGMTILLVDDSQTIRRSASQFLAQAGYAVVTATDGFEALAKVVAHQPAMILIDIMMPRLDGYQTCALIKNNAQYRDIPVVMLSSKDGLFDKARARVVGSGAHLSKPFTQASLAATVRQHTDTQCRPPDRLASTPKAVETSDA